MTSRTPQGLRWGTCSDRVSDLKGCHFGNQGDAKLGPESQHRLPAFVLLDALARQVFFEGFCVSKVSRDSIPFRLRGQV
jgi:hypothetical protein